MSKELEEKIASLVSGLMTDGFNRSLRALNEAGAIDLKKMKKEYRGVGSKYYDMVTEQMDLTVEYSKPLIKKMISEYEENLRKCNEK
ncbi:MAG: hypothetical protein PVH87_07715 [Desulfobacteraceae bacterium]|jgi:predicted transcriptional regulator